MELTITRTSGLMNLIEFKTTEKSTIYFENDFGMIKKGKIILNEAGTEICVYEIETIQLHENDQQYNAILISTFKIVFSVLILLNWNISIFIILLIPILVLLTSKFKSCYVKITFLKNKAMIVNINKSKIKDVKKFIKQFNKYKEVNS